MDLEIKPLTKNLKEAYLYLFDNMPHKENPEWAKCYCNDYHFLGDVEKCTRALSREMIIKRIEQNELAGYLVFDDNEPVGWCNANNRARFQRLLRDFNLIDNPNDKVCSIVCFLIHPNYRRKGITQKILERVISDYAKKEYDYIETYPRKGDASAANFNGHMALYKRNGFTLHKEHDSYYVMRKILR